jgi:hypothetical protein
MPAQLYETEIYDRDTGAAFAFITIPRRSVVVPRIGDAEEVGAGLGLQRIREVASFDLAALIDATLIYPDELRSRQGVFATSSPFARYLIDEPVVPFEASPLEGKPLAALIGGPASGASIAVGFLLGHPLIVVLVPAGIILCGAARGIAEALHVGLRARILQLMGVQDPDQ